MLDGVGVGGGLAEAEVSALSGGQEAKVSLAAIELSAIRHHPARRADQRSRLRRVGAARDLGAIPRRGGMVIVSHDRDFLERTVTTVLELDPHSRSARASTGADGAAIWPSGERGPPRLRGLRALRPPTTPAGGTGRAAAPVGHQRSAPRDAEPAGQRQGPARLPDQPHGETGGQGAPDRTGHGQPRSGGEAFRRVGPAVHHRRGGPGRHRGGPPGRCRHRAGHLPDGSRGSRDRLGGTGGTDRGQRDGKIHTGLGPAGPPAADGRHPVDGTERGGGGVGSGPAGHGRPPRPGPHGDRAVSAVQAEARSLLAKFGLDAEHVTRPTSSLSPGERTRAELAIFQGAGSTFWCWTNPPTISTFRPSNSWNRPWPGSGALCCWSPTTASCSDRWTSHARSSSRTVRDRSDQPTEVHPCCPP